MARRAAFLTALALVGCAGDPGDKTGTSSPTDTETDTQTDTETTDTDPTDTDPTDTDTVTDTDPTDTDTDTVTDTDTDTVTTLPTGLYGSAPGTPLGLPAFSGVIDMSGAVASNTDLVGQPTVMWFYPAAFSGG